MSSRALRKLYGRDEIILPEVVQKTTGNVTEEVEAASSHSEDETQQTRSSGKKGGNLFAMLSVDNEDEVQPSDNDEEANSASNVASTKADKKRKKKKAKKQKAEKIENKLSEPGITFDNSSELLRPATESEHVPIPTSSSDKPTKPLLQIDCRNLNPQNEMRRIFGARVVQSEGRATARRRRQGTRLASKQNHLVMPRDNWLPMLKLGLSMELVTMPDGSREFMFVHSKQYQQVQIQFWDAVETLNPQSIVEIVQDNPFHVDSLLQLSEVFKLSEDVQTAAELVERAVYAMENCFHPLFNIASGNCRLDYRRPENRAIFLAVFRHLNFVGQRGCYLTALEFCKLLLNFDPDNDPLCILLTIDFYALKSSQYDFLIDLFYQWEPHRNLSQLPNFAFSVPLAMFHRACRDGEDTTAADKMLQNSLLMFPGFLLAMLDKCSIQPDSSVAQHEFFTEAGSKAPGTLQMLTALYVARCHPCWKEVEVVRWLETNVQVVLAAVNGTDPRVADYQDKRQNRYRGAPKNIYRHLMMSDVKEALSCLPPEIANTPVLSYDPLPPEDSIISYSRPVRSRRPQPDQSLLSLFVRSILPTFNPNEPQAAAAYGAVAAAAAGEEQGAEGGNTAGLMNSMRQLMEAMRNLLANIQPAPLPADGVNHDNDDEWNNDSDDDVGAVRDFGLD